ncbi:MAG: hypothetical protein JNM71_12775 [Flavobacterium lindanitolerans]|uniref:hypothetical protein n=1 Tax=Flavobacterium lindanitolerans TaxID=428988 RepID=UPI001A48C8D8|nr:hypothetical protein [Flavobacterium lindanitolerans]MBL7868881.1 hypothetical protein [Flavobacterium lindanitolerans]
MHFSDTKDNVLKMDAMISHFLHIPFPEELPDTVWAQKWAQVKFLADKGILGNFKGLQL